MKKITNAQLSLSLKNNYKIWKVDSLRTEGYFIIFNKFATEKLKFISGNALKLYIYLGIYSNTQTGEVWHSNKTIAEYFDKSERTIRLWMKELERLNLIYRLQLNFNKESHTYLQPYIFKNSFNTEKYNYTFRFKNLINRENISFILFEDSIINISKKYFKTKIYYKFNDNFFNLYTYSPIDNNLLNNYSNHLSTRLNNLLNVYVNKLICNSKEKIKIDYNFVIENFKYVVNVDS